MTPLYLEYLSRARFELVGRTFASRMRHRHWLFGPYGTKGQWYARWAPDSFGHGPTHDVPDGLVARGRCGRAIRMPDPGREPPGDRHALAPIGQVQDLRAGPVAVDAISGGSERHFRPASGLLLLEERLDPRWLSL